MLIQRSIVPSALFTGASQTMLAKMSRNRRSRKPRAPSRRHHRQRRFEQLENRIVLNVAPVAGDDAFAINEDDFVGAGAGYGTTVIADTPLSYWRLNESAGATTAADETGSFDGTYVGPTLEVEGPLAGASDTAAAFEGSDYVNVGQQPALNNLLSDFTVEAWFNRNSTDGSQMIVGNRSDVPGGFGLGFVPEGGGNLTFTTYGIEDYQSSIDPPTGEWRHVVVVFDGSNDVSFYLDGQFVETVAGSAPAQASDADFNIGRSPFLSQDFGHSNFDGRIDEVAIYDRSSSAAEIADHYDSAVATSVLQNDTDEDGDALSAAVVSSVSHGTLDFAADGTFRYTPDADFSGTDSFTYLVNDGTDDSNVATVAITVNAVNDPPVAHDDVFDADEDSPLIVTNSPLHSVIAVDLPTLQIAVDDAGGKLWAVVGSDGTEYENSLVSIDLETGEILNFYYLNATPSQVKVTDNGQYVYVRYNGRFFKRFDVASETFNLDFDATTANNQSIQDWDLVPGQPDLLMANRRELGTFMFQDGVEVDGAGGHDSFTVSDDGTRAWGYQSSISSYDFYVFAIDGASFSTVSRHRWGSVLSANQSVSAYVKGRVLASSGTALDEDTLTAVYSFPTANPWTPDSSQELIFTASGSGSSRTFRWYDSNNGLLVDSVTFDGFDDGATNLQRFGNDGLAFRDGDDQIYLIRADQFGGITQFGVLRNDTDADGDTLTTILVDDVEHGELTLNNDGTFTYTPDSEFSGADSFRYQVNDGTVDSNVATVVITVNAVNDAPAAVDDSYETNEDFTLNVSAANGVLDNDSDEEGDPITATPVSGPSNGSLTFSSDGSFVYTPNANFFGTDSFTYLANDGKDDSDVATVAIVVHGLNDAPVANDDAFQLDEDTSLAITTDPFHSVVAVDLPARDIAADDVGGKLWAVVGSEGSEHDNSLVSIKPETGEILDSYFLNATPNQVEVTDNGQYVYVLYNDRFFKRFDVASQTFDIEFDATTSNNQIVGDWDLVPGQPDLVMANRRVPNSSSSGTFMFQDGMEVAGVGGHESFTISDDGTRAWGYQNWVSSYDFYVFEIDGASISTVSRHRWGSILSGFYHTLDYVEGYVLASNGRAIDENTLTLVYSFPAADPWTPDSSQELIFTASGSGSSRVFRWYDSNNGLLVDSVTIDGFDDGTANLLRFGNDGLAFRDGQDQIYLVRADEFGDVTKLGVLRNDTDAEEDALTAILVDDVEHGMLTFNEDGTFEYVPNAEYAGQDSFTYRINDGTLDSNTATVVLTINPMDDPPTVVDDTYTLLGETLNVSSAEGVLSNDEDPEGAELTATLVDGPEHGTVTLGSDGSFEYVAGGTFDLTDQFTYTASDGQFDSQPATVLIQLDAPTIEVGQHYLIPNAPDQIIDVFVTGGQPISGVNIRAQIGDGTGPLAEPIFSAVDFTDAVWEQQATTIGGGPVGGAPQFAQANVQFNAANVTVPAFGLLVRFRIDTTGIASGTYDLLLSGTEIGVDTDFVGSRAFISNGTITVINSAIVGRHVFYNDSLFDGYDPAITASDDHAVATDKTALLPGDSATFANYTSYYHGLNGIVIDVASLTGTPTSLYDFEFRVGNDDAPDQWNYAPEPSQIVVWPGAGEDDSFRVMLAWPNGAIVGQWLQVTMLATPQTGLVEDEVFYFGNAPGESGDSPLAAFVDGTDFARARDNPRNFLNPAPIDFPYDYNRDTFVDGFDLAVARDNNTNFLTALQLIYAPPVGLPRGLAFAFDNPDVLRQALAPERAPKKKAEVVAEERLAIWQQEPIKNVDRVMELPRENRNPRDVERSEPIIDDGLLDELAVVIQKGRQWSW